MKLIIGIAVVAAAFGAFPAYGFAQERLEFSGWIPYWRTEQGIGSYQANKQLFDEVNPFFYTVRLDGTLNDASGLSWPAWSALRDEVKAAGARFVPTVMWSDADTMDAVFRDPARRQEHIRSIAAEVYAKGFDGIDIDYEAKYARTRPYFSLFLKELADAIGYDKWISCTIESRTPLDSRYPNPASIPADIEYANDFAEINRHCDTVKIMAYDQMRIDARLNMERGTPYIPVADVAWVEKVMRLAMADISPSKLVVGVPTYGYEYDMFEQNGMTEYSRLWSFNPGYGSEQAEAIDEEPRRNAAGELELVYPARDSVDPIRPLPDAMRVMTWSDAAAIRDKVGLAERLGLRGVALFKVDGGEDPDLWDMLAEYR